MIESAPVSGDSFHDQEEVSFQLWPSSYLPTTPDDDADVQVQNTVEDEMTRNQILGVLTSAEFAAFLEDAVNTTGAAYPDAFSYWYMFVLDTVRGLPANDNGPNLGVGVQVTGRLVSKNVDATGFRVAVRFHERRRRTLYQKIKDVLEFSSVGKMKNNVRRTRRHLVQLATFNGFHDHLVYDALALLSLQVHASFPVHLYFDDPWFKPPVLNLESLSMRNWRDKRVRLIMNATGPLDPFTRCARMWKAALTNPYHPRGVRALLAAASFSVVDSGA